MERNVNCQECGKWFSQKGIKGHIWKSHGEGKTHNPRKGSEPWNKGLKKEDDIRVAKNVTNLLKYKELNGNYKHTEESKENLRQWAIKNNLGGHTSKKKLYYKNFLGEVVYLQSSFEEKVAKELDKNKIKWTRPQPLKWVDRDGKEHRYYPDFYLIEQNVYLDPKNDFLIYKDEEKIQRVKEQNNIKIFVLNKDELTWDEINKMLMSH